MMFHHIIIYIFSPPQHSLSHFQFCFQHPTMTRKMQFQQDFAAWQWHGVVSFMMFHHIIIYIFSLPQCSLSRFRFCFQHPTMTRKKSRRQRQRNTDQQVAENLNPPPQDSTLAATRHRPPPPGKGPFTTTALTLSLLPKKAQHSRQDPPLGSARLGPEMEQAQWVTARMPQTCWTSWTRVMSRQAGRGKKAWGWKERGMGVVGMWVGEPRLRQPSLPWRTAWWHPPFLLSVPSLVSAEGFLCDDNGMCSLFFHALFLQLQQGAHHTKVEARNYT